jgi:CelD/BcsL family acetyltransferase involved in cellulose biosynthesis
MELQIINEFKNLYSLKHELSEFTQTVQHNIFSTSDWIFTWWNHFGLNKKLLAITIREKGEIICFAPLMIVSSRYYGLFPKRIQFIGTPDSDYNDILVSEYYKEQCYSFLMKYLIDNKKTIDWDYIDFTDVPENDGMLSFLNISDNLYTDYKLITQCPFIDLPLNFDVFFSKINRKFRNNIRRTKTHLKKDYELELVDYSKPNRVHEGLEIHFKLHQNRWLSQGKTGIFANQTFRDFHNDLGLTFSKQDILGLYVLHANGSPVASIYGFKFNSTFSAYSSGMDVAFASYGVGNLIWLETINKCIEDRITKIDFLRGNEAYKYKWNAKYRKNYSLTVTEKRILPILFYTLFKYNQTICQKITNNKVIGEDS